jgi:CRP/FNR family transcriptional regulator, cyclic AMP receptor protein
MPNADARAGHDAANLNTKKQLRSLERLSTRVEVPRDKVLMRAGEIGREVMVITAGTARVERDGRQVATVGPGQFVGELSLLTGGPRTADVRAETDMVVNVLNRQEFASLLDVNSHLAKAILLGAIARLHENAV